MTTEIDNDIFFAQLIHKSINEEYHSAEASMRCNKIGWGSDYFKYITIEPLYTEAEQLPDSEFTTPVNKNTVLGL